MKKLTVKCYTDFYRSHKVHTFDIMVEDAFDPLGKPLLKTHCPECKSLQEVSVEGFKEG